MYRSILNKDRICKQKTSVLPSSGMIIELGTGTNSVPEGYARVTVNLFRLGNETFSGVVVNALVREYERYREQTGQKRFNGHRLRIKTKNEKDIPSWGDFLRVYDAVAEGLSFAQIGQELCPHGCGQAKEYLADKILRARYKRAVDLIEKKGYLDFIAENFSCGLEGDSKCNAEVAREMAAQSS